MKENHRPLDEQIKMAASTPEPGESVEFWADFKARAKLTNQDSPVRTPLRPISIWSAGVAFASLLLVVGFFFLPSGSEVMATEVQFIEVQADHAAVMILSSDPGQGTVIWIEGMTLDNTDGRDT